MDSLKILNKLISFKTDNNEKEINNCIKYIQNLFNKFGWKTVLLKNNENNKYNLVAILNGDLHNINDGLLLAGHIDTVTTNIDKWQHNPLNLTQVENNLYGLGVADMKAFTSAILSNLEKINKINPTKPVIFALTNDEETVMYGVNKVVEFMKENSICPKYAIIGEPSNSIFSTSNKGFYEFETIINGKACHSSTPQFGTNAIYIVSKLISFLESLSKKYAKKGTTINVGTINGGTMCNVVADKCTIRWDVRTFVKEDLNQIKYDVVKYLKKILKEYNNATYSNEIVFKIPPFEYKQVDITNNLMKKYKIKETSYSASTEAGFYQELGIDCVIFGCGDIKDCHAIDEKINKLEYIEYQNMLLNFINEIC